MKPERIGEATCKSVERIEIDLVRGIVSIWPEGAKPDAGPRAARAHYRVRSSLDRFARADGFADWLDMRTWFIETHSDDDVFVGVLIRW